MFFKSNDHTERLLTAMHRIGKVYSGKLDQEYGAALYILTADQAIWNKTRDYVDSNGIDFEAMLKEVDFSGGYGVLVTLAWNLFNGHGHLDPIEFMRLDESNFQIALNAIIVRRYSLRAEEL